MGEYTYMSTGDTLFVSGDGKSWLVGSSEQELRSKLIQLIKDGRPWSEIKEVLEDNEEDEELREWCNKSDMEGSGISFNDTTILIDGVPIYGALCKQIRLMHDEGLPLEPMINFVRKMRKNPSYRIREQLWGFIEACQKDGGFTIADDGDIMAYKVVGEDYKDKHSGRFDNSIGSIVSMPREEVDDNPANTCSAGLHFCAYSYVNSFSGDNDHLMLVKVNPADVVSIPADYDNAKARCCRYEVVDEIKSSLKTPVWRKDREENCGCHRNELEYHLGDKVKAHITDYEFPHNVSERIVVGRIVAVDAADYDQPYKVRFFDGIDIVEWWIFADEVVELVKGGDEPYPSFEEDDECLIYDTYKGKVMSVDPDDGACIVRFIDADGEEKYSTFEPYDLTHIDSCSQSGSSADEEECDELKKKLEELQELLKSKLEKLGLQEKEEPVDAEEFVRKWLAESPKKMVISFLETQYDDIMDSRMRLNMLNDIPVGLIVRKLMDWYFEEYDGNITESRAWDKIKTTIKVWLGGRN